MHESDRTLEIFCKNNILEKLKTTFPESKFIVKESIQLIIIEIKKEFPEKVAYVFYGKAGINFFFNDLEFKFIESLRGFYLERRRKINKIISED